MNQGELGKPAMAFAHQESAVRLFPLGQVVLFPHALLPLHIFEQRYRQMTEHSLRDDRRFALVLPLGTGDTEPVPIHSTACLGEITQERRLPDGRYTLLLRGLARIRIVAEIDADTLYRQARVQTLEDLRSSKLSTRRQLQREIVVASLKRLVDAENDDVKKFLNYLTAGCPEGMFTDIVGFAAPLPIEVKQELLAEPSVDRRLEILCQALHEPESDEEPQRGFPSEFGDN